MASTPRSFKDLSPPSAFPTLAELNGEFRNHFPSLYSNAANRRPVTQPDTLPRSFEDKDHAPLIELKSFSPPYGARTAVRASVLLRKEDASYNGPKWALVYYADLPRVKLVAAYTALERLMRTPGDLLGRYFAAGCASMGVGLVEKFWGGSGWVGEEVRRVMGRRQKGRRKKKGGEERIVHVAFHPGVMVVAMATTYSRVHLFDLRTNMFLDYYLVAADVPGEVCITSVVFNAHNVLAVGLDTGYVDIWTVSLGAPKVGDWTLTNSPRRALGPLFEAMLKTPVTAEVKAGTSVLRSAGETSRVAAAVLRAPRGDEVSGAPFGYRGSPTKASLKSPSGFFDTRPSPGTRGILAKRAKTERARLERVGLVTEGFVGQDKLVGSVTALAFSPSGCHLAIGTSMGGVWIYSVIRETLFRVYTGAFTAASVKCTCLTWDIPPGVKRLPMKGEGPIRYQPETGLTALVAGMESGLIVYIQIQENGASGIVVDASPVEFYPSKMAAGVPEKGVGQVLLVPSPPVVTGAEQLYASFPTLVVSMVDSPGIHIFRLIPESVLNASVPSAASIPPMPAPTTLGGYMQVKSRELYKEALVMAGRLLGDYCGTYDRMKTVHVGTLDTGYVAFPPVVPEEDEVLVEAEGQETHRQLPALEGYGGIVKSMAIDPTARRLIVSFSPGKKGKFGDSVVWFDASAITSSTSALGALGVLRPQRVMGGDGACGGVGEVRFAGGFEGAACAGVVTGGGTGVSVFPAWIGEGEEEEGLGEGYKWCGNEDVS